MNSLQSPRHLVASLFSSLSSDPAQATGPTPTTQTPTGNPLKDAPPSIQKGLLTLHVLFPNELLPALDLLDRGLVTRFIPDQAPIAASGEGDDMQRTCHATEVYHVQSAAQHHQQHSSSRYRSAAGGVTSYEVRLQSWNCSCPAFAFATFPAAAASEDGEARPLAIDEALDQGGLRGAGGKGGGTQWTFGGLTRGFDLPVCKHLLACVLVEHCEIFKPFAIERQVSVGELAGWAAGWGD